MVKKAKIEGVITAILTPFDEAGKIYEKGLRALIDFQVEKGVNALFPCGTTGEGPLMSPEERKKVAEIVIEQVDGRIPVMVHIGAMDTNTCIELAAHAEEKGADALGCVTPYYYTPDEAALVKHYEMVAEATSLPFFVYNLPKRTGINVTPELMVKLAKIRNIVGIKDSGGNLDQVKGYINSLGPDFTVIVGSDALIFPALKAGAKGVISALSNVFPEPVVELYKVFKEGNLKEAEELQKRVSEIRSVLKSGPYLQPYKEGLKLRGINAGIVKRPLRPMTDEEIEALKRNLKNWL